MIEVYESAISVGILCICSGLDLVRVIKTRRREWVLLAMFHILYMMSSLYWLVYVIFFGESPQYTHIAELGWYVSYLVLLLLLQNVREKDMDGKKYPASHLVWIFTLGMAVFYIIYSEGDYISNIICAVLMGLLLEHTVKAGLYCREKYGNLYRKKLLYRGVFIYCFMEYLCWTMSCFFYEDSWTNPYYISDILMALSTAVFIPAVDRVVRK